jgi:uncharacterized protein YbbC (DUF1343 family)
MKILRFLTAVILMLYTLQSCAQSKKLQELSGIQTAAEQTEAYLPLLQGKKVGIFANQTSVIKNTHLVDSLLLRGVIIKKIFGPEHGFRGKADAGEHVNNDIDSKTGIPIISLYGNHKKPTAEDLKDLDILVFDIQDVGVRFYTFISSLEYFIEAALENNIPLIILDRPNPNGFYVDGPVLDKKFKSFVGMQPVPVVYGLTLGEYALMLCGEKWLSDKANKNYQPGENSLIKIIPCKNYSHSSKYILPVNPSPNLKQMQSIYLYPSTCFFEGTILSEGRGTDYPFQIFGHPDLPDTLFSFTPKPNEGAKSSKCFNQKCYGWNLSGTTEQVIKSLDNKIQLKYLLDAYTVFPGKDSFFLKNNFFHKLAGNDVLMEQIKKGWSEEQIRKSWEPELSKYKAVRKKYLLYD